MYFSVSHDRANTIADDVTWEGPSFAYTSCSMDFRCIVETDRSGFLRSDYRCRNPRLVWVAFPSMSFCHSLTDNSFGAIQRTPFFRRCPSWLSGHDRSVCFSFPGNDLIHTLPLMLDVLDWVIREFVRECFLWI